MAFQKLRTKHYPEKKMNVSVYQHIKTGAIHYHTEYDTTENSFNVVFNTYPTSSNGVPHILEHSVLRGSQKYPLKNTFFSTIGRNFDTFLNAMTSPDNTQYPCSSIDETGFLNLMDVYLDAAFFPILDEKVFQQEGWRYEIQKDQMGEDTLNYTGVVFNEMIGAYNDMNHIMFNDILKHVFNTTIYANDYGGNPVNIPDLTYKEFKAFHQEYYHPSNATFFTFGSIPVEKIHAKLDENVLSKFDKKETKPIDLTGYKIPDQTVHSTHPGEKGLLYNQGWVLNKFKNLEELYEIKFLLSLLHRGSNDLANKFMDTPGISFEGIDLMPIKIPAINITIAMDDDKSKDCNEIIVSYFNNLIKNGISEQEFNNVFDHLELKNRLGSATSRNIGMSTINEYLNIQQYDIANLEDAHNMDLLKKIRKNLSDPVYLSGLIKKTFINNPNTYKVISKADPLFGDKLKAAIKDKLSEKEKVLTSKEKDGINKINHDLNVYNNEEDNPNIIPTLDLKSITLPVDPSNKLTIKSMNNSQLYSCVDPNNGVVHTSLYFPLTINNHTDLYQFNLMAELLNNMPLKNKTLEETSLWRETGTNNIIAQLQTFPKPNGQVNAYLEISCLALEENTQMIIDKIKTFIKEMDFSKTDLIKQEINNNIRDFINNFQDDAHILASLESQSHVHTTAQIDYLLSLNFYTEYLYQIKNDLTEFSKIKSIYENLFNQNPIVLFCGNEQREKSVIDGLSHLCHYSKTDIKDVSLEKSTQSNKVIDFNLSNNHVIYSFQTPAWSDPDSGCLRVLEKYLVDYLITNIRVKGGAYGAKVVYEPNGSFRFLSYRDPKTKETIQVFDNFTSFIKEMEINDTDLEIRKLNLIKEMKMPLETLQLTKREFVRLMKDQPFSFEEMTQKIINTTVDDLKRMVDKYFINQQPKIVIATNQKTINDHFNDWEIHRPIDVFSVESKIDEQGVLYG